ncbi:MAG: glycosyltransferase [Methanobacteriaceae archaeon]|nr:glycosyltransferase [Methanobacteriaceae archaeon]
MLITVGIIARNEEKYISNSLKSLFKQTFDHSSFEIIVVDGNSQDRTREIAEEVLSSSDIKYKILNEKDFGFYGHCFARNLVIDNSSQSSEYIAYTDADCIVDKDWLKTLYESIKDTGEEIAGAGGPRLIAPTDNKKELIINHFLTSIIASGGNPAFSKRNVKYLMSIPNYNAIYKKDVIAKFRYDDSLIMSDDTELNLRLGKAGYKFLYVKDARIYHRETDSVIQLARNMVRYGVNIGNAIKKLRLFKIKVFLTILLLFYLIFFIPSYFVWGWIVLIPLGLYLIYAVLVFLEILFKTRSIYSLLVFLLVPIQHICYAYGVIYNFLFVRPVHKDNK